MTVHKFTVSSQEGKGAQERVTRPYSLSQYLRRHVHLGDSSAQVSSGNTAVSNWCYKVRQQRHLAISLLLAMALYCAYLAFDLLAAGRTLEGVALMGLVAIHMFVVWRQMRSELNWPSQLTVAVSILALYGYLLLKGGELQGDVLWALTIAPGFFFLLGHFWGSVCFSLALSFTIVVFYAPSTLSLLVASPLIDGDYIAKERFLGVFMLLGMYSFLLEYDRSRVVGSLMSSRDRLRRQASTDELTGLANRHHMRECLTMQERRSRQRKEHYGLILADIDRFKQINDQYGHDCGDCVIAAVADRWRSLI